MAVMWKWNHGSRLKASNVSRKRKVLIMVSCLISFPIILVYLLRNKAKAPSFSFSTGLRKQKWNSFDSLVQMGPTAESRNGTDVIWQIPNSPKAVLFLVHGCNGRAGNFWDRSPGCLHCVGLPEERLITLHALARSFAVVSVSSKGRCWSFRAEVIIIKDIITRWVENHSLKNLPLVALGASSGGHFVSVLAAEVEFSSVAIMIAEGKFGLIEVNGNYPPALFVHMPKDISRRRVIDRNVEVLRSKGVDVSKLECVEFPLLPELLSDRIPGLDWSVSIKLFELFRRKGFVDENGYMRNDGRRTRWREALEEDKTILLDEHLVQPVQEEMNLAFAFHEMTSLYTDQILKWFESHMN